MSPLLRRWPWAWTAAVAASLAGGWPRGGDAVAVSLPGCVAAAASRAVRILVAMQTARPAFDLPGLPSYFGGKGGQVAVRSLLNLFPPHRVYLEPFLGSGRVLRTKARADLFNGGYERSSRVVSAWADAPPGVSVVCGDAFDLLPDAVGRWRDFGLSATDILVYCDPPYLLSSRKVGAVYDWEFSDADHVRLWDMLKALPCMVVVSHLPCVEYDNAFASWRSFDFLNATRRGGQVERVYHNFERGTALHQYEFVGQDRRERERIRRNVDVMMRRYERLPISSRVAFVEALECRRECDAAAMLPRLL